MTTDYIATFELSEFEAGEVSGNVQLGRLESYYEELFAEVIEDGENGFLVSDEETWYARLSELVRDASLRKRLGDAARRTVQRGFSLRAGSEQLVELLERLRADT